MYLNLANKKLHEPCNQSFFDISQKTSDFAYRVIGEIIPEVFIFLELTIPVSKLFLFPFTVEQRSSSAITSHSTMLIKSKNFTCIK